MAKRASKRRPRKVEIDRKDLECILYAYVGAAMVMGLSYEQMPNKLIARIQDILDPP